MTKEEAYKKYLHLYVGSEAKVETFIDTFHLTGVRFSSSKDIEVLHSKGFHMTRVDHVTLYLRPLSSMTDSEALELVRVGGIINVYDVKAKKDGVVFGYNSTAHVLLFNQLTPAQFTWLLEKGFDVFGLIEQGHAKPLL